MQPLVIASGNDSDEGSEYEPNKKKTKKSSLSGSAKKKKKAAGGKRNSKNSDSDNDFDAADGEQQKNDRIKSWLPACGLLERRTLSIQEQYSLLNIVTLLLL